MKIDGITLYLNKTLVIGMGDEVTNCNIGFDPNVLNKAIDIPKETVESGDYKIEYNKINLSATVKDMPNYDFVYH